MRSKSSVSSSSMTSTMLLTPIAPTSRPSRSVTGRLMRSYLRTKCAASCWSASMATAVKAVSISASTASSPGAASSVRISSVPLSRPSWSVMKSVYSASLSSPEARTARMASLTRVPSRRRTNSGVMIAPAVFSRISSMMNISLTPFASQSGPPPCAGGVPCVQGPPKQTKPQGVRPVQATPMRRRNFWGNEAMGQRTRAAQTPRFRLLPPHSSTPVHLLFR